jgi:calcium-binding protein CML
MNARDRCLSPVLAQCAYRFGPLRPLERKSRQQNKRLDALADKLVSKGELITDLRHGIVDMVDELASLRLGLGRVQAASNVAKATNAVLHLTETFDTLDKNDSGGIDVSELRRGLSLLGMGSHSPQADAIIEKYCPDGSGWIDIKTFTTLVRDIHLLLTYDQDGSGTLDTEELIPALEQLGLKCRPEHADAILRAFDADRSGKLDLIEFTDLCKSLQTFTKFDSDGSGEIDIEELRPALRRLGIPSDNMQANAVMRWYDADDSGKIELPEFAMLARDIAIFNSFDTDANGALDAGELLPALSKLGLAVAKDEVAAVLNAWDNDGNGTIDLLEFSSLVHDMQVFSSFDHDGSGSIDAKELKGALKKLGVDMNGLDANQLLDKYDTDKGGGIELAEFRQLAEDLPSLVPGARRGPAPA